MYRSSDDGGTWTAIDSIDAALITRLAIAAESVVALTDSNRLYTSGDKGATWSRVPSVPGVRWQQSSIAFAPDGSLLLGSERSHYRSTDMGATWASITLDAATGQYHLGANGYMYLSSTEGLFRSPNGYSDWVNVFPLSATYAPALAVNAQTLLLLGDSLFVSHDNGSTWRTMHDGIENHVVLSIAAGPGGRFYAGTSGGGVFGADVISSAGDDRSASSSHPIVSVSASGDDLVVQHAADCTTRERLSIVDATGAVRATALGDRVHIGALPSGAYFVRIECGRTSHMPFIIRR